VQRALGRGDALLGRGGHLAGGAGHRVGAGKIQLASARSCAPALAVTAPELMVTGVAEDDGGSLHPDEADGLVDYVDGSTVLLGPGFTDRLFDKAPKYVLIISSNVNCEQPSVPGSQVIYRDARFKPNYAMAGKVKLDGGFAWCIYKRKPEAGKPASSAVSPR